MVEEREAFGRRPEGVQQPQELVVKGSLCRSDPLAPTAAAVVRIGEAGSPGDRGVAVVGLARLVFERGAEFEKRQRGHGRVPGRDVLVGAVIELVVES